MVILAPSCNLDVYINYCYNQLTYTLLEVCVCAHACVAMCVLFYFCVFLPWLAHLAHWSLCVSLCGALFLSLSLSLLFLPHSLSHFWCKAGAIHRRLSVCAHMCTDIDTHTCVCSHMEPILRPDVHFATTRPLHATLASYIHTHTHTYAPMHRIHQSGSTSVIRKLIG